MYKVIILEAKCWALCVHLMPRKPGTIYSRYQIPLQHPGRWIGL
jgi:hypothetical protein